MTATATIIKTADGAQYQSATSYEEIKAQMQGATWIEFEKADGGMAAFATAMISGFETFIGRKQAIGFA